MTILAGCDHHIAQQEAMIERLKDCIRRKREQEDEERGGADPFRQRAGNPFQQLGPFLGGTIPWLEGGTGQIPENTPGSGEYARNWGSPGGGTSGGGGGGGW